MFVKENFTEWLPFKLLKYSPPARWEPFSTWRTGAGSPCWTARLTSTVVRFCPATRQPTSTPATGRSCSGWGRRYSEGPVARSRGRSDISLCLVSSSNLTRCHHMLGEQRQNSSVGRQLLCSSWFVFRLWSCQWGSSWCGAFPSTSTSTTHTWA